VIHKTVVAGFILLASPASAQICIGAGTFNAAPVHVGITGALSSHHRQLGASVGFGTDRLFAVSSYATRTDDPARESRNSLTVVVGADQPIRRDNRLRVCPLAGIELGPGVGLSAGASAGLMLTNTRTAAIIPTIGVRLTRDRTGSRISESVERRESSVTALVGVGWAFTNGFAVAPLVNVPFHLARTHTMFGVSFSYQVVRR
jgi:hypothetical protein